MGHRVGEGRRTGKGIIVINLWKTQSSVKLSHNEIQSNLSLEDRAQQPPRHPSYANQASKRARV